MTNLKSLITEMKKKIKISITSYGGGKSTFGEGLHERNYFNQDRYLVEVLDSFNNFDTDKYEIDLTIYCTAEYDVSQFTNLNIDQKLYPENITVLLSWQHRDDFIASRNDYDLFLHCENDTLITQAHVESFLKIQKTLPDERSICGFMLTEIKNGVRYPFQQSTRWFAPVINENVKTKDDLFINFKNIQQAFYLMTKKQFNTLLDENLYTPTTEHPDRDFCDGRNTHSAKLPNNFYWGDERGYIRSQPSAASEIYSKGRFKKLISLKHFDELFVMHLSNDYVNGKNRFDYKECISEPNLEKMREEYFKNG